MCTFLSDFAGIFRKNTLQGVGYEAVEQGIYTKAWVIHMIVTLFRMVSPIFGIAHWKKVCDAFEKGEEREDKVELGESIIRVEVIQPYLLVSTISIIVAGLLLDVLIWYKRKAANCLIYFELLNLVNHGFIPYDYGQFAT